jgi:hypothetical protein
LEKGRKIELKRGTKRKHYLAPGAHPLAAAQRQSESLQENQPGVMW